MLNKIGLLIAALVLAIATMACGSSMVSGNGMVASATGPRSGAIDEVAGSMVETGRIRAYADANYRAAEADAIRADTEVRLLRGAASAMTLEVCNKLLAAAREQPMSKFQKMRCTRSMDQAFVLQMYHESNGWMVAYGGDPTGGLGGFGSIVEQSSFVSTGSAADAKFEQGLKIVAAAVNKVVVKVDKIEQQQATMKKGGR